jgi:hypothetical protein
VRPRSPGLRCAHTHARPKGGPGTRGEGPGDGEQETIRPYLQARSCGRAGRGAGKALPGPRPGSRGPAAHGPRRAGFPPVRNRWRWLRLLLLPWFTASKARALLAVPARPLRGSLGCRVPRAPSPAPRGARAPPAPLAPHACAARASGPRPRPEPRPLLAFRRAGPALLPCPRQSASCAGGRVSLLSGSGGEETERSWG